MNALFAFILLMGLKHAVIPFLLVASVGTPHLRSNWEIGNCLPKGCISPKLKDMAEPERVFACSDDLVRGLRVRTL